MSDSTTADETGSPSSYVRTAVSTIAGDADLRTLLVVSLLSMAVTDLYRNALPLYFEELSIPIAVLGVGLSIGNVLEVVAGPVVGAAADEYDRFLLAAGAALVLAVALLGVAAVGWAPAVVTAMVLFSVARIGMNHAITPAVSEALEDAVAGIGWGIRDVAIYLGSAVGLGIGGVVLSRFGTVRSAFLVLVVVALVLAALLWRRRDTRALEDDGDGEESGSWLREVVASRWPRRSPRFRGRRSCPGSSR